MANGFIKATRDDVFAKVLLYGTPGCVDCDTEFFNGREWKKIRDYEKGDKVLEFYTETGEAKLCEPLQYHKYPADTLWEIVGKYGVNQCLSDEHNVLYVTSKNHYCKRPLSEVRKIHEDNSHGFSGKFQTTFFFNGPGIDLTDAEIKVMCAVICDGSFQNDGTNCRFHIKKNRKKEELRKILTEANIKWKEHESVAEGYTDFYAYVPRNEKEFGPYWYNCNHHQLQVICDNILNWDGNLSKPTESGFIRKSFSANNKKNADFVQFAFTSCGYRASIKVNDRVGQQYFTCGKWYTRKSIEYDVKITDRTLIGIMGTPHPEFKEYKTKDGFKYCFTTPSSNLVLRRGNNIFVTGNSGKSYSALRLANGFAKKCGSRVALIDTENGRASYYASEFDFDTMILDAPYTSKKYIDAIDMAIDAGYKVLIIDSLSHEWIWCNEIVNSMPGASGVQKWGKVKQQYHNPFVEKIIQSKIHIFATARGSTKFDRTEDGKIDYKKFTDGIAQDKDTEFNYTATFMLAQDTHVATCSKDNTHLFEDRFVVLTEKDGERLYHWCKSDNAVVATVKTTETMSNVDEVIAAQEFAKANNPVSNPDTGTGAIVGDNIEELKNKITSTFGMLRDKATTQEEKDDITKKLYDVVSTHNDGKKNWLKTNDVDKLNNILDALTNYKM